MSTDFRLIQLQFLFTCILSLLIRTDVAGQAEYSRSDQPRLHLSVRNVDEAAAERLKMPAKMGVEVTFVVDKSEAANLGLKKEDVIFLVASQPVKNENEFRRRFAGIKPGDRLSLSVFRDGEEIELTYEVKVPNAEDNLKLMTTLAERNDPYYLFSMGRNLEGRDNEQALKWHRRAVELGYRPSMVRLGSYYRTGGGKKPDYAEALKWYERGLAGADEDDPQGAYEYGIVLLRTGKERSEVEKGLEWITRAASMDFNWAWLELGQIYQRGIKGIVEPDLTKAFRCFQRAEQLQNPVVAFHLGECYEFGNGVTKSYPKAFEYYQKVPTLPAALSKLATFYQFGFAVDKDLTKARDYFEKASKLGDALASNNLGAMYEFGQGVEKNVPKGVKFYELAAKQGSVKANQNLGRIYSDEEGEFTDLLEARKKFEIAARGGLTAAMVSLGFMHMDGKGGEKSRPEALRWFQMAAERGNPAGASALGMFYENGWAVPRDRAEAIAWYLKAAAGKDQWAIKRLKELQPKE